MTIHSFYGPDGNRIAEYNEATGVLIRQYIWLEGAPIAVIEGGVISFVRSDHIGRPVVATNSSGVKTWTAAYLPFGGVRVSTGTPPTARFPGRWFQGETGLHQNWMRDYDSTTGRYMQADPLGLVDGASVYGYARQSPGRYVDPRGEDPGPPFGASPPESIPGGPWTWSPDPNNSRGGTWQNGQGGSGSWDGPDQHWDFDDGRGNRQRYNRWGAPIDAEEAHGRPWGPRRFPFPRVFPFPFLYIPPICPPGAVSCQLAKYDPSLTSECSANYGGSSVL